MLAYAIILITCLGNGECQRQVVDHGLSRQDCAVIASMHRAALARRVAIKCVLEIHI